MDHMFYWSMLAISAICLPPPFLWPFHSQFSTLSNLHTTMSNKQKFQWALYIAVHYWFMFFLLRLLIINIIIVLFFMFCVLCLINYQNKIKKKKQGLLPNNGGRLSIPRSETAHPHMALTNTTHCNSITLYKIMKMSTPSGLSCVDSPTCYFGGAATTMNLIFVV